TTDAMGHYRIKLSPTDVRRLTSRLGDERKAFYLYFQKADQNLFSASAPISIDAIGDKIMGATILATQGDYTGKALKAGIGHLFQPAADALDQLGPLTIHVKPYDIFES